MKQVKCTNTFENVETGIHRHCKRIATHLVKVGLKWEPVCSSCALAMNNASMEVRMR